MFAVYDVGAYSVALLGLAFFLVWSGDRLLHAAWLWGWAHLALALASITGHRYQLGGPAWFGAVAVVFTGFYLVCMFCANQAVQGRVVPWWRLVGWSLGLAALVAVVGFGVDPLAGRLLVLALMVLLYVWSSYFFFTRLQLPWVGGAFALRAAAFLFTLVDGPYFATVQQSLVTTLTSWGTNVVLGLVLVSAASRQSRRRLEQVIRHLPDAVVARRIDGTVLFCNDSFARLAGVRSPRLLVGQPVPLLSADEQEATRMLHEINAVAGRGAMTAPVAMERRIRRADGGVFPAEIIYSSFSDFGQIVVLAQVRDLTERKQAEEERLRLVTSDLLTGLPNRQHLEFKLRELLARNEAREQRCALLLIDIDHFKKVNDALGHLKGDEVLREISELLGSCCQGGDLLARVGGDEFVMVMSGLAGREAVLSVEDRARQVLAQLQREVRQGGLGVTMGASIGIAFSQPQGSTPQALLQHAELALYEAKAHGRGEWRFFSDDMDARLAASLRLESALRSALAEGSNELQLHYQPICDAHTGEPVKVEALLRWTSPTLGPVGPDRFIPIAEQSALILDLGHWVMNEAMRQVAAWRAAHGHAPVVSVNVSVRQFLHKDFELQLYSLLLLHGLPASQIELELTESVLAGEDEELQGLLARLRDAGWGLSLDDFGTGYSSLSYLARFRLSTVKIDRSFVRGVDQDARKRSLVRAIVSMGHSLGLTVVAEGVETEAERGVLLQEGCDQLQGYLLGRPAPAQAAPPTARLPAEG